MVKLIKNKDLKYLFMAIVIVLLVGLGIYLGKNFKTLNKNESNSIQQVQQIVDKDFSVNVYKDNRDIIKFNNIKIGLPNDIAEVNELDRISRMYNNKDFKIYNIKLMNHLREEKVVYNFNEVLYVVFDYILPKGIYYFNLWLDLDDYDKNRTGDIKSNFIRRSGSGTTSDHPLVFRIFGNQNDKPIKIKKINIVVYSAGEYRLPVYTSSKSVNITLETLESKEEKAKNKNNEEPNIQAPSTSNMKGNNIGKNKVESELGKNKENRNLLSEENSKKKIMAVSGEESLNKVLTNNKRSISDGAQELVDQEEDDCLKLNQELSVIVGSETSDELIQLLEPLLPRLEQCSNKGMKNAQEYIDLYYEKLENKKLSEVNRNGKMGMKNNQEMISKLLTNQPTVEIPNQLNLSQEDESHTIVRSLENNLKNSELEQEISQGTNEVNFTENTSKLEISSGEALESINALESPNTLEIESFDGSYSIYGEF